MKSSVDVLDMGVKIVNGEVQHHRWCNDGNRDGGDTKVSSSALWYGQRRKNEKGKKEKEE